MDDSQHTEASDQEITQSGNQKFQTVTSSELRNNLPLGEAGREKKKRSVIGKFDRFTEVIL